MLLIRGRGFVPTSEASLSIVPTVQETSAVISNAHRWTIIMLLFVSSFINAMHRAAVSVALPMISLELKISPLQKGWLLWSFFVSYALMQIPVGRLVDRYNLRWLVAGMFSLWCLSCGLMGLAGSLAVLVVLRILLGVGESIYLPGGNRIVGSLFAPTDRGLPSSLFDCGTRFGLAAGMPLVAWLIFRFGWRWMTVIIGFAALFWVIPWLITFPSRFPIAQPASPANNSVRQLPVPQRLSFNRNLFGLSVGFFCYGYFWYLLVTWLPDYLMHVRRLSVLRAGFYAALPFLVFAVSELFGGWIVDHLIHHGWNETLAHKGLITVSFTMGLLLIPATFVSGASTALLFLCGAALVGLCAGDMLAILQRCAPPHKIGLWTGIQNFAGNLGGISALTTGFLIGRTGSYLPGFLLGPAVLMTGLIAYWFIVGELRPPLAARD
jgi:MFS transporter, ACS family, D-galactonate transporter